ncbi:universal stress protein [Roseivivax sediminis]|uniref:Nucleotide-binding universal stress protein, UspA family n=1 Tax=Roseivivax sediminis TaxID=936889 RepID=A0A1I1ZPF9_9RHOB|nr:universal stress protein [Roseivivax sediminis]SFE33228.1 Nucleotide-binding universal stress protein, UspA family [Roseivivax sediminis]
MPGKMVVGYDGSPAARRALDYAVAAAKAQNASLVIAHVLEWSPYSFLTKEEVEERHMRRTQELERAETHVIGPVREKLEKSGLGIETAIRYGHSAEILLKIASDTGGTQIVVGRDGNGGLAARMFGSTAGTLVQIATLPCTIVP